MVDSFKIEFQAPGRPQGGDLVVFVSDDLKAADSVAESLGTEIAELIARGAPAERFKG